METLIVSGQHPVELEISSPDSVALWAQIPIVLTATNHLDFPITLSFGAPALGGSGGSLWFHHSDTSPSPKPIGPEPLVLASGQTGSFPVDLGDYHAFRTIRHHDVVVNFDLLSGQDSTYTDRLAYFGFKVVPVTTAIENISWGELKD